MKAFWRSLSLALLALWLLTLPGRAATQPYSQMQYIMGTLISISVYHPDPAAAQQAVVEAFAELRRQEGVLSDFNPASELNRVLQTAHLNPVAVSADLYEALERSLEMARLTGGAFDITIGPLIELWGFKDKRPRQPSPQAIAATRQRIGYQHLVLSPDPPRLFLKQADMRLDFGAIGKGLAIGKAAAVLKARGIASARLDAVSNQYYLGAPPGADCWTVGIRHPRREEVLRTFCVRDTAVSTSGDYEQYFIADGTRYSHILDPRTGYPSRQAVAATVVAADSALADALSTALLLLDAEAGHTLARRLEAERVFTVQQDASGLKMLEYHR